jgi:hypothetical protein
MRVFSAWLLCLLLVPCVGCGEKVDTSHRSQPGFVKETATDPGAIMPKGLKGPPETWSTKPAEKK